ncbi:hypothetical protein BN1048_00237 [Jeotgalicoccus saudimassiliensis]|uniref:Uncharacterized protein n=1 Tax=Jeotgalicoccus saudimassiliensis TaxID=1461582 RepID=A0A078LYN4_9STAP|nr:hypothetical protein BN1048_00237 [Jeotgalicoccus saudimassiliensis]
MLFLKRINFIILAVIVLVLTACGTNPKSTLDEYKEAVLNEDADKLIELLSDENVKVTKEEAVAHSKLVNEHYSEESLNRALEKIIQNIENIEGDSSHNLPGEFKTIMVVESVDGEVVLSVNREEVRAPLERAIFTYEFNGEELTVGDNENDHSVIDNLIPGIYRFEGMAEMNGIDFEMTVDVNFNEKDITRVTDDAVILNFAVDNDFKVENQKAFAGDEEITDLGNGNVGYGPIFPNNTNVYFTGEYEGQTVKTNVARLDSKEQGTRYVYVELSYDQNELTRIDRLISEQEETEKKKNYNISRSKSRITALYDTLEIAFKRNSREGQENILKDNFMNDNVTEKVLGYVDKHLDPENIPNIEIIKHELVEQNNDTSELKYNVEIEIQSENEQIVKEHHQVELQDSTGEGNFKVSDITFE